MNNKIAKRVSSLLLVLCMAVTLVVPALAFSSPAELVSGCNADAWEVLRLTNKERMANGLQPLSTFATLQSAANIRTEEIKTLFAHDRPDGTSCVTVLGDVGLDYTWFAENIAMGQTSPAEVVDAWMNSPGHRANILNGDLIHGGMGASDYHWVQLFLSKGCSFDSLEVLPGANGFKLASGASIDDLGAAVKLHCSVHGDCYLPLSAEMCSGANTSSEGTSTVTVSCNNVSGTFTLEVGAASGTGTVEVTLDANGGTLTTGSLTLTVGQPYGTLPTPTREGYRFDGWFDGDGNKITEETPVAGGNHTITAGWVQNNTCVVTFDPGDGTLPAGTSAQATVTTGQAYGELPTPTRTGYRFDGWYNVSGEPVTAATAVTAVREHTLVAHWTKIETTSGDYSNFSQKNTYTSGQFTDVPEDSWYANMVKTAYELGLVKGSSDTTYNPNGNITIVETLALACRLHSIYTTGSGDFTQGTPWYQVYVDYALANGIISSGEYSDYTATATRAQFASILAKALPADALTKINNVTSLPDVKTSDSFAEPVFALYNAGILTGSDSIGTFNPQSNITRSEVATIVARMALPAIRRTLSL